MPRRILILSRNYPNHVMPGLGPWVEGLVRSLLPDCEMRVVAPVPYCPPVPRWIPQSQFRKVRRREQRYGVDVWHPRFLTGPGYSTHGIEGSLYYRPLRHQLAEIQDEFPFELIHAHFSYPDGVAAVRLGEDFGVPVLITEHAPWRPWMDQYPKVRRQAKSAALACAAHVAVSRSVRATIAHFTGDERRIHIIPVGFDPAVFAGHEGEPVYDRQQVLYVGRLHRIKGVDLLLEAMAQLRRRGWSLRLVVVGGGSTYRHYQQEEARLRRRAEEASSGSDIEFRGPAPSEEVAALMRSSALVVLPSRLESFGAVLVEALACGTPVVATRCGGPEDIVSDEVGVLVPNDEVDELARGIDLVLRRRESYSPTALRQHAVDNFSWKVVAQRYAALYEVLVDGHCSWRSRS